MSTVYELPSCEPCTSWPEALRRLAQDDACEGAVYDEVHHFSLNNIGVLPLDKEGRPFHDFTIPRQPDAVYDLRSNTAFEVVVGHCVVPDVDLILFTPAPYTDFKCRFYLDPAAPPARFHLSYRAVVLPNDQRVALARSETVRTARLLYRSGVCGPA